MYAPGSVCQKSIDSCGLGCDQGRIVLRFAYDRHRRIKQMALFATYGLRYVRKTARMVLVEVGWQSEGGIPVAH